MPNNTLNIKMCLRCLLSGSCPNEFPYPYPRVLVDQPIDVVAFRIPRAVDFIDCEFEGVIYVD